jgi:hypothetical protein
MASTSKLLFVPAAGSSYDKSAGGSPARRHAALTAVHRRRSSNSMRHHPSRNLQIDSTNTGSAPQSFENTGRSSVLSSLGPRCVNVLTCHQIPLFSNLDKLSRGLSACCCLCRTLANVLARLAIDWISNLLLGSPRTQVPACLIRSSSLLANYQSPMGICCTFVSELSLCLELLLRDRRPHQTLWERFKPNEWQAREHSTALVPCLLLEE